MEVKPGYKQTEVGVIPEDWDVQQLGELKPFVTSGSRGWASYYSERGDLFVRITNLTRESIYLDLTDSRFVRLPEGDSEGMRTQLKENDVLISITADIGIIGYADARVPIPAYINQHIALLRFDPAKVNSKFVSYFLASEESQKVFRAATDTGAKAGMSLSGVQKIQTALPPTTEEQRAIATALSDMDALLDGLDRLIAKKRAIKQATMQQLLTGQTRLPGFSGEWEMKYMSDVCWFQEGPGVRNTQFTSTGVKLLNGTNILRGKINLDTTDRFISDTEAYGIYDHFLADVGDIVIACSGISVERFHEKVAVVGETHLPLCMNTSTMRFKPSQEHLDKDYLFHFLMGDLFKSQIAPQATGSAQLNFGPSHVEKVEIVVPPPAEQAAISTVLTDIDAEITALETRRTKTRALKQAMMQELLTGQIRLI